MALRYLLDTNPVSYAIKGDPGKVRVRLRGTPVSVVALSAFSQAELVYGLARKPLSARLRHEVELFLVEFAILSWDCEAAEAYGELRATQERKGRSLSHEDLMIASHALSLGLTLITRDKVFSFVDGLETEDWTVR